MEKCEVCNHNKLGYKWNKINDEYVKTMICLFCNPPKIEQKSTVDFIEAMSHVQTIYPEFDPDRVWSDTLEYGMPNDSYVDSSFLMYINDEDKAYFEKVYPNYKDILFLISY